MWYAMSAGDANLAEDEVDRIRDTFLQHYAAGIPPGAALLSRIESAGDIHCKLIVYFTPRAESVAVALGALPCPKPSGRGLRIVAAAEGSTVPDLLAE